MSTLYHGTNASFDKFAARRINTNFPDSGLIVLGYSFTPHRAYAKQFGETLLKVGVDLKNPYYATSARANELEGMHARSVRRWKRKLLDEGYDGVIFAKGGEAEEHVPFDVSLIQILERIRH